MQAIALTNQNISTVALCLNISTSDLVKWSNNTQFFIATHSAQVLSSTYYKNIILLDKKIKF